LEEILWVYVKPTSTPGYPLQLQYATNKDVIEGHYEALLRLATLRVFLWMSKSSELDAHLHDPYWLVVNGFIDPSSIFIKNEPHPLRKLKDGRYRCISPVSIVDQMVEKYFFLEMSEDIKEHMYVTGSAIGIGFSDDQTRSFVEFVKTSSETRGPKVVSDDVKSYDAVHTVQIMRSTVLVDSLVYDVSTNTDLFRAWARWAEVSCFSPSVISGMLVTKSDPGMLNSGSADTSRRNTLLRCLYACYIGALLRWILFPLAAGDDGLTWGVLDVKRYVEAARSIGITLRDVVEHNVESPDEVLEFCSHGYSLQHGTAYLSSWRKAMYGLLCKKELAYEDAGQVLAECRHNDPRVIEAFSALVEKLHADSL
jgi:hypothetical protein